MKMNNIAFFNLKNCFRGLKFLFSRVAFAYVIMILLSHAVIDFDKIKFGLGLRQLNFMMPNSYDYLLDVERTNQSTDAKRLLSYYDFYATVIEVLPQRADAYGMLGFCYYYGGDLNSAVQAFNKAHQLMPNHFWFLYNLGVIYYNLGNYDQAQKYFKEALNNDLNLSYSFILNSTEIYRPILKGFDHPEKEAENRIIQAAQFCQELVKLLDLKLKNQPVSLPAQLVVRIF